MVAGALAMPPTGDYHGLRSERRGCGDAQIDLSHADQRGRDSGKLDGGSDSADGNRGAMNRGRQLRGRGAGGGGRAGGDGRRHGACTGEVQSHNAAARRRCGRDDRAVRIREHTGSGGSDGERGGCSAAVIVDGQDRQADSRASHRESAR